MDKLLKLPFYIYCVFAGVFMTIVIMCLLMHNTLFGERLED